MCYDIKYLTQKNLTYAKRMGESKEEINRIESDLNILTKNFKPQYHASGFNHPQILCFIKEDETKPILLKWGLIPHWVKTNQQASEIRNKTINARIESLNEKASFKSSLQKRRCVILLDGFYEHYHHNKRTYPFFIFNDKNTPIIIGGLWDEWITDEETTIQTVTVITTKAKGIMKTIHNNPKLAESRMPLLLNKSVLNSWLSPTSRDFSLEGFSDYKEHLNLKAYSVKPLRGKYYSGNTIDASHPFDYPTLNIHGVIQ